MCAMCKQNNHVLSISANYQLFMRNFLPGNYAKIVCAWRSNNNNFYREVLERLTKERPNIKNNWALHHNNVPCHTVILTTEFLASKNIVVAPQPSYSLNFSTCDFFLFPRLNIYFKECHSTSYYRIRLLARLLNTIEIRENF